MNEIIVSEDNDIDLEHPISRLLGKKNPLTVLAYNTTLLRASLFFTESEDIFSCPWEKLTPGNWLSLVKHLQTVPNKKGIIISGGTLNKHLSHLRALLDAYFRDGLISVELLMRCNTRKTGILANVEYTHVREPRALEDIEIADIVDTFEDDIYGIRDRALFFTLLYAGLRRYEAKTLTWDCIDLERERVIVHGKGNKTEWVPLHPKLTQALLEWREYNPGERVFCIITPTEKLTRSISANGIRDIIDARRIQAGVRKFVCHDLRKTLGTKIAKVNVRQAQLMLRHKSITSTERYIMENNETEQKLQALDALDFGAE